jgi:hypothetical protein
VDSRSIIAGGKRMTLAWESMQLAIRGGICTDLIVTEMYEAVMEIMLATGAPTLDDAFAIFTDVESRPT